MAAVIAAASSRPSRYAVLDEDTIQFDDAELRLDFDGGHKLFFSVLREKKIKLIPIFLDWFERVSKTGGAGIRRSGDEATTEEEEEERRRRLAAPSTSTKSAAFAASEESKIREAFAAAIAAQEEEKRRSAELAAQRSKHFDVTRPLAGCSTPEGRTPLHFLCDIGNLAWIQQTVLLGCRADAADDVPTVGWQPIHVAARRGHCDVVDFLVGSCSVDVNARDDSGWTALFVAAVNGHADVAKTLVEKHRADIHAVDADGATAILYAAKYDQLAVVELLLSKKCKLDAPGLLHAAVAKLKVKSSDIGKKINKVPQQGVAVEDAEANEKEERRRPNEVLRAIVQSMEQQLPAATAAVLLMQQKNAARQSALHVAVEFNDADSCRVLCALAEKNNSIVSPNDFVMLRDAQNRTALDIAVAESHEECAQICASSRGDSCTSCMCCIAP